MKIIQIVYELTISCSGITCFFFKLTQISKSSLTSSLSLKKCNILEQPLFRAASALGNSFLNVLEYNTWHLILVHLVTLFQNITPFHACVLFDKICWCYFRVLKNKNMYKQLVHVNGHFDVLVDIMEPLNTFTSDF